MNLQAFLTLLSGPQGWLLIGSGILLLLVLLVYRRLGKLVVATRRDLTELHQTMEQLAERMDAMPEALASISAAVDAHKDALIFKASALTEAPSAAVEDTDVCDVAPAVEADAGPANIAAVFTSAGDSELNEDLQEPAAEPEAPVEDTYSYEDVPAVEADAGPANIAAVFTSAGDSELSEDLQEPAAAPEAPVEDTCLYEDVPVVEADAEPADIAAVFTAAGDSELSEDLQEPAAAPEAPVEDTYLYEDVPVVEAHAEPADIAAVLTAEGDSELPEDLPSASEEQREFGEFQFGTAALPTEADEDFAEETQQNMSDEPQDDFQSFDEPETFTFGSGEGDAERTDVDSTHLQDESSSVGHPASGDASDTLAQAPSEITTDPSVPSQSVSQEPLSGVSESPSVGVVRCGDCGRKIAYPKRLSGKRMRCPACRSISILP